MFGNLRISHKLQVMVAIAVIGIMAVASLGLWTLRNNVLEDRKAKVRELVLLARDMVDFDHENAVKTGMSEGDAAARAKDILHRPRFDGTNYFFALDKVGMIVAHGDPFEGNRARRPGRPAAQRSRPVLARHPGGVVRDRGSGTGKNLHLISDP